MRDVLINSWTLGGVAAIGCLVVGRKKTWGWLILFTVQLMWIVYGVMEEDPGFMVGGTGFATLNMINYLRWRKADRAGQVVERALSRRSERHCCEVLHTDGWEVDSQESRL